MKVWWCLFCSCSDNSPSRHGFGHRVGEGAHFVMKEFDDLFPVSLNYRARPNVMEEWTVLLRKPGAQGVLRGFVFVYRRSLQSPYGQVLNFTVVVHHVPAQLSWGTGKIWKGCIVWLETLEQARVRYLSFVLLIKIKKCDNWAAN